ncbi:glycosyltransferase family 2 protein [Kaistella sp. BT6-1-3]|uniref:Glycosyltransferase family 2 protein n=1 Tax=Kaistella yananensis TaxID=2989820 RepID=A0ABT3JJ31_9FLAO|nr:glycosyltransferase family A protein [Kaistella yananensis]MCW4450788.1 glycosyltransferase family 2 protein [Kaistella yananensis]
MFSVIIPYYKKRKYIERCIGAVLAQSYQDFEIILVDDGSQDDVAQLIEEKYSGKVHLIQQDNQGVSAARNTGIAAATHDYIAFLDADDYWSPFYLACNAEIINNETDVKIIGSHYTRNKSELEIKNNTLDYFKFENYFKIAIRNTFFLTSATVVTRDFFEQNPGFNSNLKRGEDIDVWLRVVASSGKAFYINNTLVYYSDEDSEQATSSIGEVANSLVGTINEYYKKELRQNENQAFSHFVSKYVYFNLYPYFFNKKHHQKAKENLNNNRHYYFFLHLPYYLPLCIGEKIMSNKKLSRLLRWYLKFFLIKIYI